MMGKRYVILGGNQVKTKLVSQKLSHLLGLEIIDGDVILKRKAGRNLVFN